MKDLWFFLKLFKPHSAWLAGGVFLSLLTAFASIALLKHCPAGLSALRR